MGQADIDKRTGGSIAAFVFPRACGHTNPSLPLARGLVSLGWTVEFCGCSNFREAIEDTGANFHATEDVCADFAGGDLDAATGRALAEAGVPADLAITFVLYGSILTHKKLPGVAAWFGRLVPDLVVYCPMICSEAMFAARKLRIPSVALHTCPGPGNAKLMIESDGKTPEFVMEALRSNEANMAAVDAIRRHLNEPDLALNTALPIWGDNYAELNLVTTSFELADPLTEEEAEFYRATCKRFEFVGPLLDKPGAKRCTGGEPPANGAGPKLPPKKGSLSEFRVREDQDSGSEYQPVVHRTRSNVDHEFPMEIIRRAADSGRKLVLVSLGTEITRDYNWSGTGRTAITGKQLCQSVFEAVFTELGDYDAPDEALPGETPKGVMVTNAPLIIVATGSQEDALQGLCVPGNAICRRSIPQMDILRLKPHVFVTHGGQNSLMEAMSAGTPIVVCPGCYDQPANADKAQRLGVGLKVDRPKEGDSDNAAAAYKAAVQHALRDMLTRQGIFAKAAQDVGEKLSCAGGVGRALELLTAAGKGKAKAGTLQ